METQNPNILTEKEREFIKSEAHLFAVEVLNIIENNSKIEVLN